MVGTLFFHCLSLANLCLVHQNIASESHEFSYSEKKVHSLSSCRMVYPHTYTTNNINHNTHYPDLWKKPNEERSYAAFFCIGLVPLKNMLIEYNLTILRLQSTPLLYYRWLDYNNYTKVLLYYFLFFLVPIIRSGDVSITFAVASCSYALALAS